MRVGGRPSAFLCLLACGVLFAGCGSGGGDSSTSKSPAPVGSAPAPAKAAFPSVAGKSLEEVLFETSIRSKYLIEPAAMVFYAGENRFPLTVREKEAGDVGDAQVALYFSHVPTLHPKNGRLKKGEETQAKIKAREEPARGPYPASIESLATRPAFRAASAAAGPETATAVYSTEVDFPGDGEWVVAAMVREPGGKFASKLLGTVSVGEFHRVPRPGDTAPLIHTPPSAGKVDYAEALGKQPIVLLFTDLQFCQSRACGPVVDVTEQVRHVYGNRADFLHMELYKDNNPENGIRPQVAAFHLPTEPWLFAVGRDGRVRAVIEGAFGVEELTRVVKGVVQE